jgi:hypothetical protein
LAKNVPTMRRTPMFIRKKGKNFDILIAYVKTRTSR